MKKSEIFEKIDNTRYLERNLEIINIRFYTANSYFFAVTIKELRINYVCVFHCFSIPLSSVAVIIKGKINMSQ